MTEDEVKITTLLAEAWGVYTELPDKVQVREFQAAIHIAQCIILARPTLRTLESKELSGDRVAEKPV